MGNIFNDENIIVIDYYLGAYGPTIRIDIQSEAGLEIIKDWFSSLSKSNVQEINIHECSESVVKLSGLKKFFLGLTNEQCKKSLVVLCSPTEGNICQWENTPDYWMRCLRLISHNTDQPWHQYLTEEGLDDALIEVSVMEEPRSSKL